MEHLNQAPRRVTRGPCGRCVFEQASRATQGCCGVAVPPPSPAPCGICSAVRSQMRFETNFAAEKACSSTTSYLVCAKRGVIARELQLSSSRSSISSRSKSAIGQTKLSIFVKAVLPTALHLQGEINLGWREKLRQRRREHACVAVGPDFFIRCLLRRRNFFPLFPLSRPPKNRRTGAPFARVCRL